MGSADSLPLDRKSTGIKKTVKIKLAVMILLLLPLAISYSDEKSYITIANRTEHFLHLIVDSEPYLYITPNSEVTHESEPRYEFFVRAFYSPGQEVREEITRTIAAPYYHATTGCGCNSETGWSCSETPERGGSVLWEITSDTMLIQP